MRFHAKNAVLLSGRRFYMQISLSCLCAYYIKYNILPRLIKSKHIRNDPHYVYKQSRQFVYLVIFLMTFVISEMIAVLCISASKIDNQKKCKQAAATTISTTLIAAFNQKRLAIAGMRAVTKLIAAKMIASHMGTSVSKMPDPSKNVQANRLISAPKDESHIAGINAFLNPSFFVMLSPPQDTLQCTS